MRALLRLFCSLVLLLALSGAAQTDAESYFYNTTDGAKYVFDLELKSPKMNVRGTMTDALEGTRVFNGKTYQIMTSKTTGIPGMADQITLIRKDTDGIHAIDDEDPNQTEYLMLPTPLPVGTTWTAQWPEPNTQTAAAIETITVNGKTYKDCMRIDFDGGKVQGTMHAAKGIGMVKIITRIGPVTVTGTLREVSGI
jgi:hypothetical protein